MSETPKSPPSSFDLPQESDWHRMISEAAYYRAQSRGFESGYTLDDWLAAEQQVRHLVSPPAHPVSPPSHSHGDPAVTPSPVKAADSSSSTALPISDQGASARFATFAATQAAGDGIQGDVAKPHKTVDEKIGANMADRK